MERWAEILDPGTRAARMQGLWPIVGEHVGKLRALQDHLSIQQVGGALPQRTYVPVIIVSRVMGVLSPQAQQSYDLQYSGCQGSALHAEAVPGGWSPLSLLSLGRVWVPCLRPPAVMRRTAACCDRVAGPTPPRAKSSASSPVGCPARPKQRSHEGTTAMLQAPSWALMPLLQSGQQQRPCLPAACMQAVLELLEDDDFQRDADGGTFERIVDEVKASPAAAAKCAPGSQAHVRGGQSRS